MIITIEPLIIWYIDAGQRERPIFCKEDAQISKQVGIANKTGLIFYLIYYYSYGSKFLVYFLFFWLLKMKKSGRHKNSPINITAHCTYGWVYFWPFPISILS